MYGWLSFAYFGGRNEVSASVFYSLIGMIEYNMNNTAEAHFDRFFAVHTIQDIFRICKSVSVTNLGCFGYEPFIKYYSDIERSDLEHHGVRFSLVDKDGQSAATFSRVASASVKIRASPRRLPAGLALKRLGLWRSSFKKRAWRCAPSVQERHCAAGPGWPRKLLDDGRLWAT